MSGQTASNRQTGVVTALFRRSEQAERGYEAALALGYDQSDINLVMSEETREQLTRSGHRGRLDPQMAADAEEGVDAKGAQVGGPGGATLGTLAPVIAAVGTLVMVPGLVLAGPIAAALAAAGAVAIAGGIVGALTNWGIPDTRIKEYEAGIRTGGIVLGIEAEDAEDAARIERAWQSAGGELVQR